MDLKIDDDSEDEIFFGPMKSLSEVRKAIMLGRKTMSPSSFSYDGSDSDSSSKIIETKSEPVLLSKVTSEECPLNVHHDKYEYPLRCNTPKKKLPMLTRVQSSPAEIFSPEVIQELVTDESFAAMEKFVSEIGSSPETDLSSSNESVDLDNTFEQVEYMLQKAEKKKLQESKNKVNTLTKGPYSLEHISKVNVNTPAAKACEKFNGSHYKQPTPLVQREIKTTDFKTPVKTVTRLPKSGSHLPFKTPPSLNNFHKSNAGRFPNIVSPIGYCIANSRMVPQIQNVRPKKGMGLTAFPTASFEGHKTPKGKENIFLPAKAYKAAKETKLIDQTPSTGLPINNHVNKMVSALPQPKVIRHVRREVTSTSKTMSQIPTFKSGEKHNVQQVDDSFANLSVVSADVSVCIGKTAARTDHLKSNHYKI